MRAQKILFVQFTDPAYYPPLQHVARIFNEKGWTQMFLAYRLDPSSKIQFDLDFEAKFFWVNNRNSRSLIYGLYVWFSLKALYLIITRKVDWVYGSDHWSLPVLYFSKKFLNKNIVYHEHDSPGEHRSFFLNWILRFRSKVSNCAEIKIVPNLKRIERTLQPESWLQVRNYPALQEAGEFVVKQKENLVIYYHGSINSERLPLCILDALELLPFLFTFKFAGYETVGSRGYIQKLIEGAKSRGLESKVKYLGVLFSREQLLKICLDSHVGLSFMPKASKDVNMLHMCGASNKPYDYLAAGCAVLVSDLPEWKEMFVQPGYGLSCDSGSAESIAEAFRQFYSDMGKTVEMGQRGREQILKEWHYEREFQHVIEAINKTKTR